ncbi:hypothetical protein [Kitasatospora terrestris]|uniref:Transglycosylase SLT domain-containing protein n=1 Tax=Kitasatospora terrestris TaxID=258051 RepID=A0ABP9DF88_9ACTN
MTQVVLSHVIRAAQVDPPAPQGVGAFPDDVRPVEQALANQGFLDPHFIDGAFGTLTLNAYRRLQESFGFGGKDADGVPGSTSLRRLGAESGLFDVLVDDAPPSAPGGVGIPMSEVIYDRVVDGSTSAAIHTACDLMGLPVDNWLPGYMTIAVRESSYFFNAVNTDDSNAHGPLQSDGCPLYCSRGVVQCIPPTFARYHQPGTDNRIYDGVANIAASMNYVMDTYGVSRDGHDLTSRVQQADETRPPHGY